MFCIILSALLLPEQVDTKAASENSNGWTGQKPLAETWEVSGSRMDKLSEILSSKTSTPYMASKPTSARNPAPAQKTIKASFDQEAGFEAPSHLKNNGVALTFVLNSVCTFH